jgi:hypothetical protein
MNEKTFFVYYNKLLTLSMNRLAYTRILCNNMLHIMSRNPEIQPVDLNLSLTPELGYEKEMSSQILPAGLIHIKHTPTPFMQHEYIEDASYPAWHESVSAPHLYTSSYESKKFIAEPLLAQYASEYSSLEKTLDLQMITGKSEIMLVDYTLAYNQLSTTESVPPIEPLTAEAHIPFVPGDKGGQNAETPSLNEEIPEYPYPKTKADQLVGGISSLLSKVSGKLFKMEAPLFDERPAPSERISHSDRIMQIENDHTVEPEGLEDRGWVRDAPIVKDIITEAQKGSTRYNHRMYSDRRLTNCGTEGWDNKNAEEEPAYLVDHTEIDALYDLVDKMFHLEKVLGEEIALGSAKTSSFRASVAKASSIRNELCFIGTEDLLEACTGIAEHWIKKLQDSKKDLFIGLKYDESSIYIYNLVMDKLQALIPDSSRSALSRRIHPISTSLAANPSSRLRAKVQEGQVICIDDWSISGAQMQDAVNDLQDVYGLKPSDIEINLVCSMSKHIATGIAGAPVRSYFKRSTPPDTHSHATVTGAHCDTDYGFRSMIEACLQSLHTCPGYERIPFPALSSVARTYRYTDRRIVDYSRQGGARLAADRETHDKRRTALKEKAQCQ